MQLPRIPGIELGSELGRGAHSIVFRARLEDGLPCAVKVPRTRARWTRWIYREAVALARVKHPGLPAVLEVGEVDDLPYLVMELVEGETLAHRLDAGDPLGVGRTLDIALQLAQVLSAVHDVGLVHRDVKPRNIVIDDNDRLKLVDFGFATPMERTGHGETAGTAAYAAPEQLVPPGRVDARSDLYCVGRVLLECLIGATEFGALAADVEPSTLLRDLVRGGVRSDLANVVANLLAHEPSGRYADAHALVKELEAVRGGTPTRGPKAYPQTAAERTSLARSDELMQILDGTRSLRGGGRLVIVQGSRGSGKSTLLAACERSLERTARTTSSTCLEGDAPLAALRRIVESCTNGMNAQELDALLGNLAPVARLISPRLGFGTTDVESAIDATDAVSEGAAEIVIRLAQHYSGLVVIIDDVQWMDRGSAEALVRAACRVGEGRLVLVLGSRSERSSRAVVERFLATENSDVPTTLVTLSALTEESVFRLVSSYLATDRVDPLVIGRINAMADGTPLGVIEVLGAFLDAAALRPHARAWVFDARKLDGLVLPTGALALLGRRLADIPSATRRVLEIAAVWGKSFDEARVAAVLEVTAETVAYASVTAHRAGVIEPTGPDGGYRFVHDSLRETLLEELPEVDRRLLHRRVAELLVQGTEPTFDELCAAARHIAASGPDSTPEFSHRVASAAARAALAHFDNEAAVEFKNQACAAAALLDIAPAGELHRIAGEAHLRLGEVAESIASFRQAVVATPAPQERAALLARIAWAHSSVGDADASWAALDQAFTMLGERMPIENATSAASTTFELARTKLARLRGPQPVVRSSREIDLLCRLHYQNLRLSIEHGKIARAIQSCIMSSALSTQTDSLATRARADAMSAFLSAALGRAELGIKGVKAAVALAEQSGDPTAATFCAQFEAMTTGWGGRFDESLAQFRHIADTYGPWMEVGEYSLTIMSGALIPTLEGRLAEAWNWLARGIARVRRSRSTSRVTASLVQRSRAVLAAMGRTAEPNTWLANQFEVTSFDCAGEGYQRITMWGPRAAYLFEVGELGAPFEKLVADFEAEKHNPRTANVVVHEFYLAVAQARVAQCFAAASPKERAPFLAKLAKATTTLRLVARMPVQKAHATLTEACLAWFRGDEKRTMKLLTDAYALAVKENVPAVTAGVALARAHMLVAQGKKGAARDQARVAEMLYREHGAIARARRVVSDFGLSPASAPPLTSSISSAQRSSSVRTHRQLAALLHVVRETRRDRKAEEVAASTIEELLRTFSASRGAIWFQPEAGSTGIAVARHRSTSVSVSISPQSPLGSLLREVHRRGTSWMGPSSPLADESGVSLTAFDPLRLVVVPLDLYEQPVGALAMEREADDPPFSLEDKQLLEMLAHQVPVALEVARLLTDREQLQASLQQAQKLEAIGQLAGGLAHDFNNMLAAMKVALSIALERAGEDEEMRSELDIIAQATTRASQLTSQLLSFSRSQPLPMQVHDVNQLIVALEPMLRRVSAGVDVKLALSPIIDAVSIDAGSFDQAIMNLLINARDAMPRGGTFTVSTRNVRLDESAALRANVPAGSYVEVVVEDNGEGMSPEVLNRIFEPFFTTKPAGRGTGLGLATVYGFVKNCGGGIIVTSEVGVGTKFTLYLKRADRPRVRRRPSTGSSVAPASGTPDTILVVDDDDLVRRSIAKILERNGYRVVAASGSVEALDVVRSQQGKRIGLVIMDVLLPGVTGPELGRRLNDIVAAKLLFVSGFSADSAPIEDAQVRPDMLLQKPFTQSALLARVRELMPS